MSFVTIAKTRNGFMAAEGMPAAGFDISTAFVFGDVSSLAAWLETYYQTPTPNPVVSPAPVAAELAAIKDEMTDDVPPPVVEA